MKLKTRLIISFLVILIVPIVLAIGVLLLFTTYQVKIMETQYGYTDASIEDLSNATPMLSRLTVNIYDSLSSKAEEEPTAFYDTEYLDKANDELEKNYSYLIVRLENAVYYEGSKLDTEALNAIFTELPEYGDYIASSDRGNYIGEDIRALVKQIDIEQEDGTLMSAFIITSMKGFLPQIKTLILEMIAAVVMILLITGGLLMVWIYKGIHSPLKKLKVATQNIKDGNLDFIITVEGHNEIGELCEDFEEMRQRLKESAEEKVEYDKENKELISNISHDLKTPITAVKGYVEGIMDGVADTPEKMDKYIRTIYNKANEMDRLINELTFYSKIDTNRIPYTFGRINVAEYFQDCVDELGLDLESKNVELTYFNYTEDNIQIIADAEQLKRVINNIVNNSVKYMDKKKGHINIRLKDVGDFIQVEIEDNGKGIGQKELPFVFDRFYRTDTSRNSAQGGSGIGLSIVRKIVEDHGGKIWATSKENTGTVMFFVIRKYQEVPVDEQAANN